MGQRPTFRCKRCQLLTQVRTPVVACDWLGVSIVQFESITINLLAKFIRFMLPGVYVI